MAESDPYIVLEELRFIWTNAEIERINEMYEEGKNAFEIGRLVGAEADEVALVLIDQRRKGKI